MFVSTSATTVRPEPAGAIRRQAVSNADLSRHCAGMPEYLLAPVAAANQAITARIASYARTVLH